MRSTLPLALGFAAFLAIGSPAIASDLVFTEWRIDQPLDESGDPISFEGRNAFYVTAPQTATLISYRSDPARAVPLDRPFHTGTAYGWPIDYEPDSFTDYQSYSYVGILDVRTLDGVVDSGVIDRTLAIGFQPGIAEGKRIEDLFPGSGYSASMLVDAFSSQHNSPEFLDMAFARVAGQPSTSARFELYLSNCISGPPCTSANRVQMGETLDLIAFNGGSHHDEGVRIGYVAGSVLRTLVPEPGPALLIALGLTALGWRAS